ncbi:MAG: hypothetical protein WD063_18985 [Pirellulales bacterium]
MLTWGDVWAGLVLPGATTAGLLVVGWWVAERRLPARQSRSWAGPLAVGAGFAAGYLALFGWPGFPPPDAVDWLLFLAPALVVVGLLDGCLQMPLGGRIVSITVAVPAAIVLLSWPLVGANPQGELLARLVYAAALGAVSLIALDALSSRVSAARLSAILLAVALPAAALLSLSGSLRYGQIAGLLAAAEAGALAVNLVLGPGASGRGTVVVAGTLLAGLVCSGNLYAELTPSDAVLLAAAPTVAWVARAVPPRFGRLAQTLVQIGLVLALAGIPVVRARLEYQGEVRHRACVSGCSRRHFALGAPYVPSQSEIAQVMSGARTPIVHGELKTTRFRLERPHGTKFAAQPGMSRRGTFKDSTMIASARHSRQLEFVSDRDRQMHAAAREVLSKSNYGALRLLDCRVSGGVVEIAGTVSSFYLKQLAQEAMLRLDPPGRVRNLVEVNDETPLG